MIKTWLTETFKIKYPIILAPMFLVSNNKMLIEASKAGFMGCIPALNWRTPEEFEKGIKELKEKCEGPFGINLIANKSNIHLKKQIEICEKYIPDFIITSLGSPEEIIKRCGSKGTKVICDVVDVTYAKKCEELGADALIAVNSGAGGHAGPTPASILVPLLKENCSLPVISAGGVGTGSALFSVLALGSEGVSIGSPFIATVESDVSEGYKQAVVDYGAKDIVMTTKVSGSPCTVINTPFVKKIGTEQNFLESYLNKNKKLKKYAKMLTYYKGMKLVEKAAFSATYKSVWCAGPSIEFTDKIETTKDIIDRLISEYEISVKEFQEKMV
ncbi:nitronate monooxygenase family protein [Halobacteriovorax sp. HLS]|uniref:NAD(P)H-dependent flavin oxidoreductase n=1 Tax=Halobacteriovorax sp. HLS TaxID=2234000 RepID=UPI000FD7A929|nr:nitronate monooxygenase [Halobacteriovorax sp. HLS]